MTTKPTCTCGEINARHCPVHGEPETTNTGIKMSIKIEKNIPIPKRGKWQQLFQKMEDGDSILAHSRSEANIAATVMRRHGIFTTTRKEGKKIRIWRIKSIVQQETLARQPNDQAH